MGFLHKGSTKYMFTSKILSNFKRIFVVGSSYRVKKRQTLGLFLKAAEPLQRDSLLLTTKSPVFCTHSIHLGNGLLTLDSRNDFEMH